MLLLLESLCVLGVVLLLVVVGHAAVASGDDPRLRIHSLSKCDSTRICGVCLSAAAANPADTGAPVDAKLVAGLWL